MKCLEVHDQDIGGSTEVCDHSSCGTPDSLAVAVPLHYSSQIGGYGVGQGSKFSCDLWCAKLKYCKCRPVTFFS